MLVCLGVVMRKRRPRIIAFIALAILCVVGVLHHFASREPAFNGRTVSDWARKAVSGKNADRSHALEAVQEMGSSAVPVLGRLAYKKDSFLKKMHLRVRNNLPGGIGEKLPTVETNARSIRLWAVSALGKMDEAPTNATALLLDLTDAKDDGVRLNALSSLSHIIRECPRRNKEALKAFFRACSNTNVNIRSNGLVGIGRIAETFYLTPNERNRLIPILKTALHVPGLQVNASYCAEQLGQHATPLVPRLKAILDSPDANTRSMASNALTAIHADSTTGKTIPSD